MHPIWAIALAAVAPAVPDSPRRAVVVAEFADVLDEPDDAAFSTGRLAEGRRVAILRDGPDGWATIAPPEGSFSFVEESELEDVGDGTARVLSRYATVRPGREGARVPGPARLTLRQGSIVRLLDRRPIVKRQGQTIQTWIAIAPPKAEVRFVRASAISDEAEEEDATRPRPPRRDRLAARRDEDEPDPDPDPDPPSPPKSRLPEVGPVDVGFLDTGPSEPDEGLSTEVSERIRKIAEVHRDELRKPIERWNLGPMIAAYENLLKEAAGPSERRAIQARLDILRRQDSAAKAASRMARLLARSRERDGGTRSPTRDATGVESKGSRRFDASGLLQTTSRMVDGRKVHALIGDDGGVVAYLLIPPGVAAGPLISQRVGVRGEVRFDDLLMAKLVVVRDLDPLEEDAKSSRAKRPSR